MLPAKTNKTAKSNALLTRALARFVKVKKEQNGVFIIDPLSSGKEPKARIGFLIDATASRSGTWTKAQKIQRQMFACVTALGPMALRLVHFGGAQMSDHGWKMSPFEVAEVMMLVKCVAGCTMILPALRAFLEQGERADAIILIGDSFEEEPEEAAALARALKDSGIKVFSFLEGSDDTAARTFRHLARTTGGAFARFGSALPLRDLCEGVALLTAGGEQAVKRLKNEKVRALLLTGPCQQ